MQLTIDTPDTSSPEWGELPLKIRNNIRLWLQVISSTPRIKPIKKYFKILAKATATSVGTASRNYYGLKKEGWQFLIPKNLKIEEGTGIKNKEFRNYLVELAEKHQRNSEAAIRKLKRNWRAGKPIPGYAEQTCWPAYPPSWSNRNLSRVIREESNKAAMRSINVGVSSKTNPFLPQVITTRTGLWPGAIYQLDDVWHDNFVTVGKRQTPARVIEIGALDLFSAARIKFGCKPRLKNKDGKFENLRELESTLFVCGLFHDVGYSPQGTMMMVEHGAAAVTERLERILYDATKGLIRLDRQPIEGKQQALTGFWGGTEGGNFRAKAALESSHNLIHNDLAHLALQTGKDSDHRPVTTDRQLRYITNIIKDVIEKAPHRAHLLKLPSLDFHSQFMPLLYDYYRYGLNGRTDHNLEGWRELGFLIKEYTAVPGSDQWLSPEQFLSLPAESRAIITASAKAAPELWSNTRYLSPWEVWSPARSNLLKIQDHIVAEILAPLMAKERKVDRGFFHWCDESTTAAELHYEARLLTPTGAYRELPQGEKFAVISNPFEDRWLFVIDAHGRYLGKCELVKRANPLNIDVFADQNPWEERRDIRSEELKEAAGHKHQRIADIQQPVRIRQAEQVQAAKDLKEHNRRIIAGEETDPRKRKQNSAKKAARTRAANSLTDEEVADNFAAMSTQEHLEPEPDHEDEISLSDLT